MGSDTKFVLCFIVCFRLHDVQYHYYSHHAHEYNEMYFNDSPKKQLWRIGERDKQRDHF